MSVHKLIETRLSNLNDNGNTIKAYFDIIHDDDKALFCEIIDNGNIKSLTYKDAKEYSYKMGTYLEEILKDVPKSSFVGLMMENRLEFITCFYGLLMAGYKPMLFNVKLSKELNDEIIERINIKYVISDKDYNVNAKIINISSFDYSSIDNIKKEFAWEDEFAISTSATSLNIKICVYDGASICEQINNMKGICKANSIVGTGYKGQIKHLAFLPLYHIFGLMAEYFWFTLIKSSFVFLTEPTSENMIKAIREQKITHIFAVPLLWNAIYKKVIKEVESKDAKTKEKFYSGINISLTLQSTIPGAGIKLARQLFKDVRAKLFGESPTFLVSGGSDIPEETIKIMNGLGYQLFNGYGMSEIGITSVELSSKASQRVKASIGKPFDKVEYKISDEGNLLVKSKGLCKRIITKTSDELINKDEYFNTGDFAKVVDGSYYVLGRSDDVVLTENGEKINPNLIEKELNIPYVDKYSVLGIKKGDKEYLSLLLELDKSIDQDKIYRLISSVSENLKYIEEYNYHIEKVYYTYDKLTTPSMIKISRKAIIKWISEGSITIHELNELKTLTDQSLTEEQIELAKVVTNIFKETLDLSLEDIKLESHFVFDLGGTSLDYLTLLSKLNEEFNIEFNSNGENCNTVIEFTNYIISYKNRG